MPASICLNMIVKNESAVIKRCLASVKPFITTWVIVDTGSTDGTQALIRDFMNDIPGELHERPWKNFGFNRTEAITLAKGKADYLLIIDADEVLEAQEGFSFPELTADAYQLLSVLNTTAYYRTQLVRDKLPWRWQGVLHEYLECAAPFKQDKLEGLINRPRPDGARSADPQKYLNDAKVLEVALKEEPNNTRYVFYLAQSYRDAGNPAKALSNYEKRSQMGGFPEEVWYSQFQVALLREQLAYADPQVMHAYLQAHQLRPSRAEALCNLARYCRLKNQFALAYLFGKAATLIPIPTDVLFVDTSVYHWRAKDEWSIAAYYLGKHEENIQLTQELLDSSTLPQAQRNRVTANQAFSLKALGRLPVS